MRVRNLFIFSLTLVIMGVLIFPFISYAGISDDLRKIRDESIEQKEARREQFRQEVLGKRKEVLSKWTEKKQGFEERLSKEREKIKSGFELRRARKETDAGGTTPADMQEQGGLFSLIKKRVQDIAHLFSPLKDLFGSAEK